MSAPGPTTKTLSFADLEHDDSLAGYHVPASALLRKLRSERDPDIQLILVSAAVFGGEGAARTISPAHHSAEEEDEDEGNNSRKILIIQRAPTDSLPLLWELPGGGAGSEGTGEEEEEDDNDEETKEETVLHATARELYEETNLVAAKVTRRVEPDVVFTTWTGTKVARCTFLVDLEEQQPSSSLSSPFEGRSPDHEQDGTAEQRSSGLPKVELNPDEHVAHLWATRAEVQAGRCGDVELTFTGAGMRETILRAFDAAEELFAADTVP